MGVDAEGTRVYFFSPRFPFGSMAETSVVSQCKTIPLAPDPGRCGCSGTLFVTLLVVAGATFLAASAKAQFSTAYSSGDLLLGFRDTDTSSSYVIDLGATSNFTGHSLWYSTTVGSYGTDLNSLFTVSGTNWATSGDVYWGAAAAGTDGFQLFASQAESPVGTLAVSPGRGTGNAQSPVNTLIEAVGGDFGSYAPSANASNAVTMSNSDAASWGANMPFGSNSNSSDVAFQYFQPQFEGNSASGITSTALDLFTLNKATGAAVGTPGTYDGTLTIGSTGTVTFAVVPEPSTVATVVLGAGLLLVAGSRRRRLGRA